MLSNPGPMLSLRHAGAGIAMCHFSKAGQAFPQQTKGGRPSRCHSPQHLWPEEALSTAHGMMLSHLCSLVANLQLCTNGKCKDLRVLISSDNATILCLQKWHHLGQHGKGRAESNQLFRTCPNRPDRAFCKFSSGGVFLQGPYGRQRGPVTHPSKMLSDRPHRSHTVVIREQ